MRTFEKIAIYCGSSNQVDQHWLDGAAQVGVDLAQRNIGMVYGGGRVGLMGAAADGALSAGGEVFGVIPEKLQTLEVGHPGLTHLDVVRGMAPRKARMMELSDAFIALPGGFGTFEEIFEVLTLTVLNYHDKPVGLLNINGFYDELLGFLDTACREGFIRPAQRKALCAAPTMPELLEMMAQADLPQVGEWLKE